MAINNRTASFQREPIIFFRSPNQKNGCPTMHRHYSCNNSHFIICVTAWLSLAIKSQGKKAEERDKKKSQRLDRERLRTKKEEQTCIPLFLLKETEEAKEKSHEQREKKGRKTGDWKGETKGDFGTKNQRKTPATGKKKKAPHAIIADRYHHRGAVSGLIKTGWRQPRGGRKKTGKGGEKEKIQTEKKAGITEKSLEKHGTKDIQRAERTRRKTRGRRLDRERKTDIERERERLLRAEESKR